jgi:aminopeptidase
MSENFNSSSGSETPKNQNLNCSLEHSNSQREDTVSSQGRAYDKWATGYARLLVNKGCDLRSGQELFISASIENADFVRLIAKEAYAVGCKRVTVAWHDEKLSRLTYDSCPVEEFETMPEWAALRNNSMARNGAAILTLESTDPDIMTGVDPAKMIASTMASHTACKEFYDSLDFGKTIWCIAGAASPAWARRVFPNLSDDEAMDSLWNAIFKTSRADNDDPEAEWERHDASFETKKSELNSRNFTRLRYKNSIGTDFEIGLPKGVIWHGGSGKTVDGRTFFPNIPTEEIYTSPHKMTATGTVHSALPLVHQGSLIDDFWIRFENGKAVDFDAKEGRDVLEQIISTDEGSSRLGEVSLVPYTSPIRQTGILFYSTLYDENASCHIALGKSFPECIENGLGMNENQLSEAGLNNSAMHVDFMIGTPDLDIVGIDADGKETKIFEGGEWAL